MAWWWPDRSADALDTALAEWSTSGRARASEGALTFGTGTRRERVAAFCAALAREAHDRWGSWKRAGEELGCDEKTLRDDAKG